MTGEIKELYDAVERGEIAQSDLKNALLDTLFAVWRIATDEDCDELASEIKSYYL